MHCSVYCKKISPIDPQKLGQYTLMRLMIIDICAIIMNNHTCEIMDFISGGKINKPLYFIHEKQSIISQ